MKRVLLYIFIPLTCIIALYYVVQWQAKASLEDVLQRKLPPHITFWYQDLTVDVLSGSIHFSEPFLEISNKKTGRNGLSLRATSISIEDIHYWTLLNTKKIRVGTFAIDRPDITYREYDSVAQKEKDTIGLSRYVEVDDFNLVDGQLSVLTTSNDTVLKGERLNAEIKGFLTKPELINERIPFTQESFEVDMENIEAPSGAYENLGVSKVHFDDQALAVEGISFKTKYTRQELSRTLERERDHFNLEIPEATLSGLQFEFRNDSLFIGAKRGQLTGVDLTVYRDKGLPDDLREKKLYGKMLKNLPYQVDIEEIDISDARVVYEEEVASHSEPGLLSFEEINGTIKNISNLVDEKGDLEVSLHSQLMGQGELQLDWSFSVRDADQRFLASGSLGYLNTASLNKFLEPNLRVGVEGQIQQLYFTISGDQYISNGDVKMRYEDFRFKVLDKDRSKIKKVLTFIGNLFVSDGSKADAQGYRYGDIEDVKRDTTKSFFNYLWISLQDGVVSVLSGNGKKE
ncbi:DUF748 domain-containing protein [Pareuzebyella sediminis]|uniref:DUF748 domain-containing protein n=1 Tax=Pareuzebyella sediminis TaxID=2607998 RepID=UPI0011EBFA0C|nr:DUF748 domain-containing protein [Pareuzebyella sediminis]